jgi:hypothetical protein
VEAMMRSYGTRECRYCEKIVSRAGFAWSSHLRKHVKDGKVRIERSDWGAKKFVDAKTGHRI